MRSAQPNTANVKCIVHPVSHLCSFMCVRWFPAQAVQAWHSAHYLHSDIKPGNIAVDEDDRVRLLDMGHSVCTKDGRRWYVQGTKGYEAPEEVASVSSELYSIGATLESTVRSPACVQASTSN